MFRFLRFFCGMYPESLLLDYLIREPDMLTTLAIQTDIKKK